MAADLSIIDLTDPSFVPLNSVARQIVFTEAGRGVETVIVDGRVVIAERKVMTINERALREEVADLMKVLRRDVEAVTKRTNAMLPYLMEAQRKTWQVDIGLNRYVGNATTEIFSLAPARFFARFRAEPRVGMERVCMEYGNDHAGLQSVSSIPSGKPASIGSKIANEEGLEP